MENQIPTNIPSPTVPPSQAQVTSTTSQTYASQTAAYNVPPVSAGQPSGIGYTTQVPKSKKGRGKEFILIGVLLLLLAGAIFGFTKVGSLLTGAESTCEPVNLAEERLTANSVEVTFETKVACQTSVVYGVSADSMMLQVPETIASLNHRVKLSPLLPSTTYYYQVMASGEKVGVVRSFLTLVASQGVGGLLPTRPVVPTAVPRLPTAVLPTGGASAAPVRPTTNPAVSVSPVPTGGNPAHTFSDFEAQFGGTKAEFDIDKNGVVNIRDWLLYSQ